MKILWYVNIVMPDAAKAVGLPVTNAGGWLTGAINGLRHTDVQLSVLTVSGLIGKKTVVSQNNITYILLPSQDYETAFEEILSDLMPDLVHIHGTEYIYNTHLIQLCSQRNIRHVVSLQGIMYQYAKHYCDGLPDKFHKTKPFVKLMKRFYDVDSIAMGKQRFVTQGEREIEALKAAKAVIGRTAWDKASALEINPQLRYYHVNESLRDTFYTRERWSPETCEKHSIFISQATYPIKGLHMLLKVLPELVKRYPDIKVYIGGHGPLTRNNPLLDAAIDYFFEYQHFIKQLIRKNHLQGYIHFTGSLTAEEMKARFLKSNVFLSCSTIENSPNSVGEAMILGVPIVASNVGGTETMLTNGKDGILFDFYDTDAMVQGISTLFDHAELAAQMSANAHSHAAVTHDPAINSASLYRVYLDICQ